MLPVKCKTLQINVPKNLAYIIAMMYARALIIVTMTKSPVIECEL